jgi:hypothetical protein
VWDAVNRKAISSLEMASKAPLTKQLIGDALHPVRRLAQRAMSGARFRFANSSRFGERKGAGYRVGKGCVVCDEGHRQAIRATPGRGSACNMRAFWPPSGSGPCVLVVVMKGGKFAPDMAARRFDLSGLQANAKRGQ